VNKVAIAKENARRIVASLGIKDDAITAFGCPLEDLDRDTLLDLVCIGNDSLRREREHHAMDHGMMQSFLDAAKGRGR